MSDPNETPEAIEPEAPPAPSPWAPLEERGFRPDGFEPDDVVNGANFWKALRSRDYQDGALTQVLRYAGFPEDMSPAELRDLAQQARQGQDPWAEMMPGEDYEEQPQQYAPDPRAFQAAVQAEIERRFAERDQAEQQRRIQESYEAEFTRELERVSGAHEFDADEKLWLAARANQMREAMPYATTAEIMDKAGEGINQRMLQRLQSLAARQQETPAAPLPGGLHPSDTQVPRTGAEAAEMWRRMANG